MWWIEFHSRVESISDYFYPFSTSVNTGYVKMMQQIGDEKKKNQSRGMDGTDNFKLWNDFLFEIFSFFFIVSSFKHTRILGYYYFCFSHRHFSHGAQHIHYFCTQNHKITFTDLNNNERSLKRKHSTLN